MADTLWSSKIFSLRAAIAGKARSGFQKYQKESSSNEFGTAINGRYYKIHLAQLEQICRNIAMFFSLEE